MSDDEGPWTRQTPEGAPQTRSRRWRLPLLIGVALVCVFGVAWLANHFPAQASNYDWGYSAYALIMVVACVGGLLARGVKLSQMARYVAIWSAIAGVLLVGYTLRDDIAALGPRILSELNPTTAQTVNPHSVALTRSENGGYYVMGSVNGQPVRFLIDTGAGDVTLSPDDARRIGVDMGSLRYDQTFETANGVGRGADYTVASLAVGPIALGQMQVSVNQAPMAESLLGMTFLRRLDSFEFKGSQLILRGRH